MESTIFGLDLSLTSTGISGNGRVEAIHVAKKGPERLFLIAHEVIAFMSTCVKACVVIEGYSFASRNSQAHAIGELGGVMRVELWKNRIPFVDVPPTVRAKFATGKGNASKMEVVSAISAKTGLSWQGSGADDKCDAWILEEMGLAAFGRARFDWPKPNMESLNKVNWSLLEAGYE